MSMFGSMRNGAVPPQGRAADGLEYWDHLEDRHGDHVRHVRNLLIVSALVVLGAIVVDPAIAGFLALLAPLTAIEMFMERRSRTVD